MLGMDNAVSLEIRSEVKEEFEGDICLDDKVLVTETAINADFIELNEYTKDDRLKLDLISTDIKLELLPSNVIDDKIEEGHDVVDIKIEYNNKQLFCNNCNEYYEEYCTKCGMLIFILNGNALNGKTEKEMPVDVLEIKEDLYGNAGIFALKTIPKGVKFGPFTGFSTAESSWSFKGGKFVVSNDKSKILNWMQYVNCTRSVSDQNLRAFQYEKNLYYSSVCEIQKGKELLVYFGEEYEENLNNSIEMYFIPHTETDAKNVFACTYCCLGFSLKVYLVEHKTVCPNGTNGNFEELMQCPLCKIFLEKNEYLECHEVYCFKGNARHCALPALDDHTSKEKRFSPVINKRKMSKFTECKYTGDFKNHTNRHGLKMFRCGICYKRFKKREFLMLHVENIHISIKQRNSTRGYQKMNTKNMADKTLKSRNGGRYFKCLQCRFQTKQKSYLGTHVKTKHLKEYDHNCTECEYKTNKKRNLVLHVKTKHLKEYDYNCTECEYKTSNRRSLKAHLKTIHRKEYDYNCTECEFKTNQKSNLVLHIRTKHLKVLDYNCTECEYTTSNKYSLKIHVKAIHRKEYDYNCTECEFKTNQKSRLGMHIRAKHFKEYDYNCAKCEYKTNQKSNLGVHIRTKHLKQYDYKCTECEYKTNKKYNLVLHVRAKHLKVQYYNCTECEYKTSNTRSLKIHVKAIHRKEYDYNCVECEYKTNKKFCLGMHVRAKHVKEYDYNCKECEYKTNRKNRFEMHVKSKHLKEYDYNCAKCEYKTNQKSNLEIHIRAKHLQKYHYNCTECEYKINDKRCFERHVRTKHFKEYDYNCMECGYKTSHKTKFEMHIKSKHLKEYDYSCKECEYKTNQKSNLERHVKTKHLKVHQDFDLCR